MGRGDLAHLGNNQHTHHIIVSSPTGIIVGHVPDQHGNQQTDMMLFNMGLISAISPNGVNSSLPITPSVGTDVQYGVGILHFYPNLGSNAPGDWEIPYFRPPNPASVPLSSTVNSLRQLADPEHEEKQSACSNTPFSFNLNRDSDFDFSLSSTLEVDLDNINETPDSHICRLNSYNDSNPGSDHKSIVLNRVSSNGSISSDISFTQSMPGLKYLTDSSTSDDQSLCSLPPSLGGKTHRYWDQKHVDDMAEDRNRRLREWRANEDRAAEAKEKFRRTLH